MKRITFTAILILMTGMLAGDSIKYSKNWRLLPHYELNGIVCKEVEFKSLNKYFGVSAK